MCVVLRVVLLCALTGRWSCHHAMHAPPLVVTTHTVLGVVCVAARHCVRVAAEVRVGGLACVVA